MSTFDTARINHNQQDDLNRISQQITELEGMLRAQHDLLRQRGMSLPPRVLEQLYYVRTDLARLIPQLTAEATELAQLRALARTTQLINSSLNLDQVLTEAMDTVVALTGAERGYIVLRSSRTGEMQFRVARDLHRQTIDQSKFTVSQTIVNQVARTGQPVVAQDAVLDPNYSPIDSIVMHAPRSILCVPLIVKGQITGVIYADNRQVPDLFGDQELSLLVAFANQAAIAIENARLFDRVQRALVEITEMKELMDNVLASIASGVITTDADDRVVTYNHAAERILGISYEDAIGRPIEVVLPTVFEGFDALVQAVHTQDRQQTIEIEPVLPNRGPVNLVLKLTPLKDANQVTYGMALVVDDLTEVKKREATLNVVRTYLPPRLVHEIAHIDSLSGDEREVSILFADVRGFTTFSEHLPPEDLMAVISRYLTICSDAIQHYDGIIDKYMGDAAVGLFNTQLNPQADHAERAVRAALTIAYEVGNLHAMLPPEQRLFYGIGIDTGYAVLGNVGSPSRREFTAIGAPFNFAKLLQENALAGEIIISQNTYQQVGSRLVAEAMAPRKVKGYSNFTVMYRVTGVHE